VNPDSIGYGRRSRPENREQRTSLQAYAEQEPPEVTGVRLRNLRTGAAGEQACDGVFVAIGHSPVTQLVAGQLPLDAGGYILAEPDSTATRSYVHEMGLAAAGSFGGLGLGLVEMAVASGLWHLRMWARVVAVLFLLFTVLGPLISITLGRAGTGSILGIIIPLLLLIYLVAVRRHFR
jgi:hypothetical protein